MTHRLLKRTEIEERERETLAPYATRSGDSRGRAYPSREHELRTAFQRDRDRIVHSAAFRRLEYKTQVFIPHERDHFRTRLTHTIEVAQVARTLARNLRLNEDLAEAISLVHDLGHTPFGHAGEDVLDGLLDQTGGFNHNRQSLRIVELLEQRYPEHPGLNLSYEVREGIVKHETSHDIRVAEFDRTHPTLEAGLVDIGDEIAYNAHDIDDGLSSGLITFDQMHRLAVWDILGLEKDGAFAALEDDQMRYALVRRLINLVATDVMEYTSVRITAKGIDSLEAVRECDEKLTGYSPELYDTVRDLKQFLFDKLYRHPRLKALSLRARIILEGIFGTLREDPERMPERFREMLLTEDADRVITDYVAGMTDRYAEKVFVDLTGEPLPELPVSDLSP